MEHQADDVGFLSWVLSNLANFPQHFELSLGQDREDPGLVQMGQGLCGLLSTKEESMQRLHDSGLFCDLGYVALIGNVSGWMAVIRIWPSGNPRDNNTHIIPDSFAQNNSLNYVCSNRRFLRSMGLANRDLKPLSPRNQPGQQAVLPAARDAISASRFYPFESYHLNGAFISLILFFFFFFLC